MAAASAANAATGITATSTLLALGGIGIFVALFVIARALRRPAPTKRRRKKTPSNRIGAPSAQPRRRGAGGKGADMLNERNAIGARNLRRRFRAGFACDDITPTGASPQR